MSTSGLPTEPNKVTDPSSEARDAEADRLASLYAYGQLDTPAERDFDQIVGLAAEICGAPMALVSLLDADRQWFKARLGIDVAETSRAESFCQHAIAGTDDVMEVPDARLDERFSANPFVTGEPYVRLYAGAVLRDRAGRGLGALCVLDRQARHLSVAQLDALTILGRQVMALMELHRESAALAHAQAAFDHAADGAVRKHAIVTLDKELRILGWGGDAERLYGYPAAGVEGRILTTVLETDMTDDAKARILDSLEQRNWWEGELTFHHRNGSPVRVHSRVDAQLNSRGERIGFLARHDDLSSLDIEALCHDIYADMVTKMANGKPLVVLSADLCRAVEKAFPGTRATLMAVDDDTGRLGLLAAPSMSTRFAEAFSDVPVEPGVGSCGTAAYLAEVVISEDIFADPKWDRWQDAPRHEGLAACWSHPVVGPGGSVIGTFGVYRDRPHRPDADERQLVATLAALATIVLTARRAELSGDELDHLTGLKSRAGLDRALARLSSDVDVCVVAMGVDRFGLVNHQYGLDSGDNALQQVAQRVIAVATDVGVVARFASDQFVLVTANAAGGPALGDELVAAMRPPIDVDGNELWLTASVGVACGPAANGQAVLHAAVAAAGRARRLGGNQALDTELPPRDLAASSLELVGALHRAVASGGLGVHYQPKVSIATGRVVGFEALVRWTRVDGTVVAPSEFIPLAEEIGLIDSIGEHVLRQACLDAAGWAAPASGATPSVAVNVSGRQLVTGQLAESVAAALADSGLPSARLTLEVTETALADDLEGTIGALRQVKALGVAVSIDDFGIGYSSLGYLSRFPVDELKIDRSFVDRMGHDSAVDAIVRSVINLSHTLGLRCVAEGVVHPDQLNQLAALGCDGYQGYLFSPAVPNEQVPPLLDTTLLPTNEHPPPSPLITNLMPPSRPAGGPRGDAGEKTAIESTMSRASSSSTKRALLVLSHAMERAFDTVAQDPHDGAPGLVIGLFQRREYFDVEASRYAALAAAGHTVIVGLAGSSSGMPAGVHAVTFTDQDPRGDQWVLMLVRGAYATSLVAHDTFDLSTGEITLQGSRLFHAEWTFHRQVALAEARTCLDSLAPDLPPLVQSEARRHIDHSAAVPVSSVENRLAMAADHLIASVDSGQRRLSRLRFELETTQLLAERDQLTGLHNRHYLERFLGSENGPADLLVLLADVDDLKRVNDVYGHEAGDAVLNTVAMTLRQNRRPGDVVVRWGGDEFLVLVPGLRHENGLEVGERLARAVASRRLPPPWADLSPSVSIGMCWTPRTSLPLDRLDAALYSVKRSGKGHAAIDPTPPTDSHSRVTEAAWVR
jgi:diguanylate cyclase (GGDEF)-like protein/PAS domain S-box-containing protein